MAKYAVAVAGFCGHDARVLGKFCPSPAVVTSGSMEVAAARYVRETCRVGVEFRVERPIYLGEGFPHVVHIRVHDGVLYSLNIEEVS